MRLYLHKWQQPSVAGLLSFLDVSSLNSAAPRGAALFLSFFVYAGRARGAPLSHGSQNGVNRTYDFVPFNSGHLAVAMGSVGQIGKGAYGLSVVPRCSRLQNSARARAPADVPLMGMRS